MRGEGGGGCERERGDCEGEGGGVVKGEGGGCERGRGDCEGKGGL